jgi:hypothetical protein
VQDENDNDPYTCEILNAACVLPFYLERIPPVSGGTETSQQKYMTMFLRTCLFARTCTKLSKYADTDRPIISKCLNK